MTPAVNALQAAGIAHQLLDYPAHAIGSGDIGIAAAAALGVPEARVFKTLIAELAGAELVVAIIPVAARLNLKQLARAAGTKSAEMADTRKAERATGYVTGGISPIGQKRRHRTFLADEVQSLEVVYVSAGKRGLELALAPSDLISATEAVVCGLTG